MASQAKPTATFMRPGFHTITPYLVIPRAAQLIEFLKTSFGATERLRVPVPDGPGLIMHAEVSIGNSIVEVADANEAFPVPRLKRFRNRNAIDGKMVEGEFVFRVERDARVVGERRAFQINEAVPADRARRIHTKELKPLLGWLWDFRGTYDERAHQIG